VPGQLAGEDASPPPANALRTNGQSVPLWSHLEDVAFKPGREVREAGVRDGFSHSGRCREVHLAPGVGKGAGKWIERMNVAIKALASEQDGHRTPSRPDLKFVSTQRIPKPRTRTGPRRTC
jgi:hypothetical protein